MNQITKTPDIELYCDAAERLYNSGDLVRAIKKYIKVLQIKADYLPALYRLAEIYESTNEIDKAIKTQPNISPMVYKNLGDIFKKKSRFNDAINAYKQAIKINPNLSSVTYINLGDSLRQIGKFDEAVNIFKNLLEIEPNNATIYLLLAKTQEQQGNIDDSIKSYQNAIKLNSKQPFWVYKNLGDAFSTQGLLKESIDAHRKAIKLKPDSSKFSLINAIERRKNYNIIVNYNYQIVSLGFNCFPRVLTTRWGLKKRKKQGELSCPFDLAVHSYENICKLIEYDFEQYLDDDYLVLFKKHQNGSHYIKNLKYECYFPHESDDCWFEEKFINFKDRYEKRINNFYKYLNNKRIVFVLYAKSNIVPDKLAKILKLKFPKLYFKILVINISHKGYPHDMKIDESILLLHIPFPGIDDKRWNHPRFYKSQIGIDFENSIQKFIRKLIIDFF